MAELLSFPGTRIPSLEKPELSLQGNNGSSGLPADSAARALALDPQHSFIVEAPAGSGKTGLLVQRFLNLLASSATTQPEEILAITFTRKATAELRERLALQLEAAAAKEPLRDPTSAFDQKTRALALAALERDRQHGWRLLTEPRRLRIQTIDSLCMEIAGSLPLLSGMAARAPVDDANDLYREAARRTLRQLGGPDPALDEALHTVLLHRDGNLADVESLLAEMLGTREQWGELVPLDRDSLTDEALDQQVRPRLERTLESIVCTGLSRAAQALPAGALATLAEISHSYSRDPGYADGPNPFSLCGEHLAPPPAEAEHLDHWRALLGLVLTSSKCDWRKGFNHNHIGIKLSTPDKDRLQRLIADIQCDSLLDALESVRNLPPARYPEEQWQQAKALFRLLLHALAELRLLFAETGECDFAEFSLSARQALAGHAEDYATSSGVALRHLLVDEMQDTSSAQYDLLTALTRTWDGSSQTLFLVGDPKQSIYLFRQARVERFLRTSQESALGDVPLQPLQLTANFRSRPAVVERINRDFERLFVPPGQKLSADAVDVPFVAAVAARAPQPPSGIHWHTRTLSGAPSQASSLSSTGAPLMTTASSSACVGSQPATVSLAAATDPTPAEQDAYSIRQIVERWRATPLPQDRAGHPWRIAVLAYARRHLAPIVAEFSRPGAPIPYRAVKVEPLQDRPEVLDAFALTRALHHPADRAAWFAVLRAPWCGLSAADLLILAAEGDSALAKSTVPELVEIRSGYLSPIGQTFLSRAWPVLQVALENTSRNLLTQNAYRSWLSLSGDALLTPGQRANVERYFALLRECEHEGGLDLSKLKRRLKGLYAEDTGPPDAVELTTIHNAKGLEWDVVIVPELGKRGQGESARLLNWLELESSSEPSILLAPIHGKGDDPTSLYRWLNRIHSRRHEAERKRIFYVACTRAREELHLFATASHGKNGLLPASGSLLHACWAAAEPHFEVPAQAALDIAFAPAEPAPLALAAAAEPNTDPAHSTNRFLPRLTRLPPGYDPAARFREAAAHRLPYTPAADLPQQAALARPEGGLAVRALGNVVHRFLEHIAARLAANVSSASLRAELPVWRNRVTASLRGEGLADAGREASRALTLLANTLADPVGLWLLSPRAEAASERALATGSGLLRVDRSFRAGQSPFAPGEDTLWIVDFKTTSPGGRSAEQFLAEQRDIYGPQLARYAEALRATHPDSELKLRLGLYYPAIPRLVHWQADGKRTP